MKKALFCLAFAAANAQAAEPFTGLYQSGSVDSATQLMLTDDQKFCFALSAGNLDVLTGGTWQQTTRTNDSITLRLTEQKLPLSDVVAIANTKVSADTLAEAEQETGSKRIVFLTVPAIEYAIGDNPLIGFGENAHAKPELKWLYSPTDGRPMYARIAIPADARYLFVGSTKRANLYRFNIGNSLHVKLNPNEQAGRDALNMDLVFNLKTRSLEEYGVPQKISSAAQQKAWQQCKPKVSPSTQVKGNERTLLNAEKVESLETYYRSGQAMETWLKD